MGFFFLKKKKARLYVLDLITLSVAMIIIYLKMYMYLPFPRFVTITTLFQLHFKSTLQIIEMAMKSYLMSNKDFKNKVT